VINAASCAFAANWYSALSFVMFETVAAGVGWRRAHAFVVRARHASAARRARRMVRGKPTVLLAHPPGGRQA